MKIAISVGDCNGIGLEILLKNHKTISKVCTPLYCVDKPLLQEVAKKLKRKLPKHLRCIPPNAKVPLIAPAKVTQESGTDSCASFLSA